MTAGGLPTGRAGSLLALGLALIVLLTAWFAVAAPLLDWYAERGARLDQRLVLARRMAALAATLPRLRQAEAGAATSGIAPSMLLEGATDAVAAATLQERVQDMARQAGVSLASAETLPATPAGAYRRIGLRVSLSGPWPVLVTLLEQVEQASPRMLLDDLQLHGPRMVAPPPNPPLEAGFTVFAFRAPIAASAGGSP